MGAIDRCCQGNSLDRSCVVLRVWRSYRVTQLQYNMLWVLGVWRYYLKRLGIGFGG